MNDKRLIAGVVLFLIGGGVLAFGEGGAAVSIGTTVGLAGVVMMGWAWFYRGDGEK